jgi:hypothetical protein
MARNKLSQESIEDLVNDPDSYITWRETDDKDDRDYDLREFCGFEDERYGE